MCVFYTRAESLQLSSHRVKRETTLIHFFPCELGSADLRQFINSIRNSVRGGTASKLEGTSSVQLFAERSRWASDIH